MGSKKKIEFHKPFVKDLAFICLVTIVSMVSVRFFIPNLIFPLLKSPIYTSHESHDSPE